jgi:hypothetical protein
MTTVKLDYVNQSKSLHFYLSNKLSLYGSLYIHHFSHNVEHTNSSTTSISSVKIHGLNLSVDEDAYIYLDLAQCPINGINQKKDKL